MMRAERSPGGSHTPTAAGSTPAPATIFKYDSLLVPRDRALVRYKPPPGWSMVEARRRVWGWEIMLKKEATDGY
jgi:hypothetical protein